MQLRVEYIINFIIGSIAGADARRTVVPVVYGK